MEKGLRDYGSALGSDVPDTPTPVQDCKDFLGARSALYLATATAVHGSSGARRLARPFGLILPSMVTGMADDAPEVIRSSAEEVAPLSSHLYPPLLVIPSPRPY